MIEEENQRKIKEGFILFIIEQSNRAEKLRQDGKKFEATRLRRDINEVYLIGERAGYIASEERNQIFKK